MNHTYFLFGLTVFTTKSRSILLVLVSPLSLPDNEPFKTVPGVVATLPGDEENDLAGALGLGLGAVFRYVSVSLLLVNVEVFFLACV